MSDQQVAQEKNEHASEPTGRKLHGPTYLELQAENARLRANYETLKGGHRTQMAQLAAAREETAEYAEAARDLRLKVRGHVERLLAHSQYCDEGRTSWVCRRCDLLTRIEVSFGFAFPTTPPNGESALKQRDEALAERDKAEQLALKGVGAFERAAKLEAALRSVIAKGHNDDCLFCGFKDYQARTALGEPPKQPDPAALAETAPEEPK